MQNPLIELRKMRKEIIVEAESLTNVIKAHIRKCIIAMGKAVMLACFLCLTATVAKAHCYDVPVYMETYAVSGIVTDNYTDSSIRFNCSGTTTFSATASFSNWNSYYFNGNSLILCPVTFPTESGNIKFYGNTEVANMAMNKRDTIYADGGTLDISNLTSENSIPGQYNVIYTNSYVTISGTAYYPGDTFYSTATDTTTAVLITDCAGISLPIQLLDFTAELRNQSIWLNWKVADEEMMVTLQYSTGIGWEDICRIQGSAQYEFSSLSRNNIFRLKTGNEYSASIYKLIHTMPERKDEEEVYTDLNGSKVSFLIPGNIYILHFKNGSTFKYHYSN